MEERRAAEEARREQDRKDYEARVEAERQRAEQRRAEDEARREQDRKDYQARVEAERQRL